MSESILAVNPLSMPPPKLLRSAAIAWSRMLGAITTAAELDAAYAQAVMLRGDKASTFPINAIDILNGWKSLNKPQIKSSAEAWAVVKAQIDKHHYDGTPVFEDPLIAKVVRDLGWRFLCFNEGAATRFDWAWREESGIYREQLQINPGFQLPAAPEQRQIGNGSFNQVTEAMDLETRQQIYREGASEALRTLRAGATTVTAFPEQKKQDCVNCEYLRFQQSGFGLAYVCIHPTTAGQPVGKSRPDWCPLVVAQG